MSIKILKKYQEEAVDELILKSKLLLAKNLEKRTIVFQAPTGSGKTFIMSQYIEQFIEETRGEDFCFLWLSPGKGDLQKQSFKSLKEEFAGFPDVYLLEEEFFGSRRTIARNEIVVANWEKLSSKDGKTGEWKNILMKDKETTNFRELIQNTKENKLKMILIIDESHSRDKAERAFELRNEIINPDLTIEMSATPILKEGQYNEKIRVEPNDVIEQEMIKKEIIINENIDKIGDDEITSQELVMEAAFQKRLQLKELYEKENSDVNPLVLIQIPNSEAGNDKKEFIERFLGEKGITKDNWKLAVWLNEEKRNQEEGLLKKNDNESEFLIFKQAIDTGWDCPRAQILVKFRESKSLVFEIQTVGRILRMPEIKHYRSDDLNRAYVFTNVKSLEVKKEDYNPNIIKSIFVKREDIYNPLKIRSYYRNRIDYGDITASFYGVMEDVFCDYFGIKKGKPELGLAEKNREKIKTKINIENLEGKEELILNKNLPAELFDYLEGKIISDKNFQSFLSEDDKERAFKNIIKINLNGFAPKRSLLIVKNSLYRWFRNYMGINLLGTGIIFIQNIVLNNFTIFSKLFDCAVKSYNPIKDKEIKQKIEETEEWNNNWEISKNRNYNPNLYKPFGYKLALYKSPQNKKTYLNFDSNIEEEFAEYLEKNKNKVLWWWQNGDEHMQLNFGIKCDERGKTFQPDFLVMFKNGTLGIFDTKASGYNESDNKIKAEALQKYIKEENKRKKKNLLVGGIVIKEGRHFRINSDEKYESFKNAVGVKDKGAKYKAGNKIKNGWRYLEF